MRLLDGPVRRVPSRSSCAAIRAYARVSHVGSVHTADSVPDMPEPALVTVLRDGLAESTHSVHVAVARADGTLVASCGDPDRLTTMRSCAKPFQVQPLLASGGFDAFGLDDEVLAVACASHSGEDMHVAAVERGLRACGLTAAALRNCVGSPEDRLRHNCSGNHLGFLAHTVHRGWDLASYQAPGHPSQQAALAEVAAAAGMEEDDIATATDGCGVLAFGLPLRTIAAMYARLPAALPRQFAAMRAHPQLVRANGELDTELMRAVPGCVTKAGAEALQSVGLADPALGVAVRVEDGAHRAVEPAVMEVLGQLLGWDEPPPRLQPFVEPLVPNAVGDPVVRISARVALATRAG
jgi:L-asparaginase II